MLVEYYILNPWVSINKLSMSLSDYFIRFLSDVDLMWKKLQAIWCDFEISEVISGHIHISNDQYSIMMFSSKYSGITKISSSQILCLRHFDISHMILLKLYSTERFRRWISTLKQVLFQNHSAEIFIVKLVKWHFSVGKFRRIHR